MRRYLLAFNRWANEHWWTAMAVGTVLAFLIAAVLWGPAWGAVAAAVWFLANSAMRLAERRKP